MNPQIIKQLIESGLPGADVTVEGDDGAHFNANIVCELFSGKNMLQQHRMVYKALGAKIGNEIHALSFKTYTPQEYKKTSKLKHSELFNKVKINYG